MKLLIALLASLSLTTTSFAADDHKGHGHAAGKHDEHAHKPKHGGIVTEVKEVQYELVTKGDTVTIYVEDHGKTVDTKGSKGTVTFLSGTGKTDVALTPAGDNKLEGKGAFKLAPGTKAAAVITLPGKAAANVKWTVR